MLKTLTSAIFGLFLVIGCADAQDSSSVPNMLRQIIPTSPDTIHTDPKTEREYLNLIIGIFDTIKHNHVDAVDDKKILEAAIRGMISELDPHSSYLNPEEFKSMSESMRNETFSGIGAQVSADEKTGFVKVISPIDGSPALNAGILAGDLIKAVDENKLKGLSLMDAVNKIRGPKGSIAKLEIVRGDETLIINVVRGDIQKQTVRLKMFDNNIGYVRLASFSHQSSELVGGALNELLLQVQLKDEKLNGIVLDLRSNPGGLLTAAVSISDMFVNDGEIVSTRGRFENDRSSSNATSNLVIPLDTPMVVLVDGGSASASEIVSGALQDLNRATIMGVKSFGKGSVQQIIPLPNGGGMRLTIAKYYTASGKVIHGVGITPDVIVELPKDFKLKSVDDIDPQLQKALDYIMEGKAKTGL